MRQRCVLGLVVAGLWLVGSTSHAVTIDGWDWRQPADTVGFSYNDLANGPCDVLTGACSGFATNAGGIMVDLTGWTWASSVEIANLFETLTGAPGGTFDDPPTGTTWFDSGSSLWAPAAIDTDGPGPDGGLFDLTDSPASNVYAVRGLTRSLVDSGEANRSYLLDSPDSDQAAVANPVGLDIARAHTGAWLYLVPEPSTAMLVALGLMALSLRRAGTRG